MKAFTDLEQSRKLAEILPLESADMYYEPSAGFCTEPSEVRFGNIKYAHPRSIRCWSLAALLNLIKMTIGYRMESFDCKTSTIHCDLGDKPWFINSSEYKNEVDACYEIIIKLKELNLL